MKFDLEKQRRRARVLGNLSIELLNLCRDCQKIDKDTNCITMETFEEIITNNDLDDLILNAIKSIRNNKKRPDCSSIYDYLSKSLSNSDITKELISSRINYLTENNKLRNKQTNGKDSYFIINETAFPNEESQNKSNISISSPKTFGTPFNINKENLSAQNSFPLKSSHLVEMATFDAFYEDYIDFKNYVNDILNSKFKNIVENAEKTLYVSSESKVDENVVRQTILEKKVQDLSEENKHLRTEVESYKKVIQLLTNEKSNVTNSWQYVSRRNVNTNNKNVLSKITTTPLNNFYEPLIDFQLDGNEYDENEENIALSKVNSITPNQSVRKRPNVCTTEKSIQNQREIPRKQVVPGVRSYASVAEYGKKVFVIGDSHLKRINRRKFNNSFKNGRSFIKSFPGAKVEELQHYVTPHLETQKPDISIIHVGGNNINYKNLEDINVDEISENIANVGKKCASFSSTVFISSILVKKNVRVSAVIRRVNEKLQDLCGKYGFHFISNDNIGRKFLSDDGIHLSEDGTDIFASNFVNSVNDIIFNLDNLD